MVDAEDAARRAVEIASREIDRLWTKASLDGFDAMDLDRYAKICLAYDNHKLSWMSKLDPSKLPGELLNRVLKETGEADGSRKRRSA